MDFSFPEIDWTPTGIVFLVFGVSALIQLLFTLLIFSRFTFHSSKKNNKIPESLPGVSIIIAARNEEDNLYKNLPAVLNQKYPEFEVVVVNHQSVDDSKHILQAYQKQYPNLKIIDIERNHHLRNGKKLPLTVGIKGAKYDHFLFTDADCIPASDNWLRLMAGKFGNRHQLILGYGPYSKAKGFLNFIIRFDTTFIATNYFAFAASGFPYMGVGRNMAYTRQLFDSVQGFKKHYAIQSGDDDLFVKDVAKKRNYTIQFHPDSYCYSEGKASWKKWFEQKQRHYTTSSSYKVFHKLLLGIYPFTLLVMLVTFVSLVFNEEYWLWSSMIFGGVIILKWIFQGINFGKLGEKRMALALPLLEIMYAVLLPIIYYSGDKNEQQWK